MRNIPVLNGLDLFSGIGGLSLALEEWVRPIAYCERDPYACAVLLSRMHAGQLSIAPIWSDVCTLEAASLPIVDIIYGGFPCQDISAAGLGVGLGGERSGLFHHIARLVSETNPRFVFLENVPAIRTRGLNSVAQTFAELGYDCRWTIVSAQEVGAPHLRKRWFMLAHSVRERGRLQQRRGLGSSGKETSVSIDDSQGESVANAQGFGRGKGRAESIAERQTKFSLNGHVGEPTCELPHRSWPRPEQNGIAEPTNASWWAIEPDVGRVANGVPQRVDRLRGLGNAVVPIQAQTAFKRLMGLEE